MAAFSGVGYTWTQGETRQPPNGISEEEEIHGQETKDNVRSGGRRRDAGQCMREQQHVAERSSLALRHRAQRHRAQPHPAQPRRARLPRQRPTAKPAAASRRSRPATPSWTRHSRARRQLPFNGKTVSIQTQWIGGEGTNFAAAVADFATATGIKIQIDSIGSSHETVLKTRIEGGSRRTSRCSPSRPRSWPTRPTARSSTSRRSWMARSSAMSMRTPSAWSPRAATSGASRTRPT